MASPTAPARSCGEEFFRSFDDLVSASGAATAAKVDYWRGGLQTDEWPGHYAEYLLNLSEVCASTCWGAGARYWELSLDRELYFRSWIGTTLQLDCQGCPELPVKVEALAPVVHVGLCAPELCSAGEVREELLSRYLMHVLGAALAFPVPTRAEAQIEELSHWSKFQLDFVIAGVDNCGTTSLGRWLQQLEEVEFSRGGEEDASLFSHDRLLPYVSEVQAFNSQWRSPSTLKGLRHPSLWAHLRVRMALARIQRLRVFLVVCDPLSRIDKAFWWYHVCNPPLPHPEAGPLLRTPGACFQSISSVLEDPNFLRRFEVRRHLEHVQRLFHQRLAVLHQEHLRLTAPEAFHSALHFLGLPAPEWGRLTRHNHRPGHRTDLCHNATLIRQFKELLAPEYVYLEQLLNNVGMLPVPEQLLLRQSRCDRLEELWEAEEDWRAKVALAWGTGKYR
eukprot:s1324_g11.t2